MRTPFLFLTIFGTVAALGACTDARSPTGRDGPQFGVGGARDSAAQDTLRRPSQFISNGAAADVSWSAGTSGDSMGGGGGFLYGSVSVNRNSPVSDEWTSVNWSVSWCDAYWNCRYSGGYGYVQAPVLAGSGGGDLRLSIDPADYPDAFYVYGEPIGPIELTWRQAAGFSSRSSGSSEYQYPGYTFRSNGVTVSSTAAVSGHVGASALPLGTMGNMGTTHAMTISFYH